jgi:lysophospholipase L1-like esterase
MSKKYSISYLALGDSLTEGIGAASLDRHWVSQYFQHLAHSEHCSFRNLGVSGMTSRELYSLINIPSFARLIPRSTHITITTGGCDFIELYENKSLSFRKLLTVTRNVLTQVEQILAHIRTLAPNTKIQFLGFYLPLPAYQIGEKRAVGFAQMMNKCYENIGRKFQAELINPFDIFFRRFDYFIDEVHPNQAGYDAISQLFIQSASRKSMVTSIN